MTVLQKFLDPSILKCLAKLPPAHSSSSIAPPLPPFSSISFPQNVVLKNVITIFFVETLRDTNNLPKVNSCGLDLDSLPFAGMETMY